MIHAFTGNLPAVAQQIATAPDEPLPLPIAPVGQGGSVRPVPVCGRPYFAGLVHSHPGGRTRDRVTKEDRIFSVTKNCTSCGTCAVVCPVKNIEMMGKKPAWKDHCELCLACIRTCPAQAIRVGSKKAVRPRYRHTGVTPVNRERQQGK
jgi:ferredoxin